MTSAKNLHGAIARSIAYDGGRVVVRFGSHESLHTLFGRLSASTLCIDQTYREHISDGVASGQVWGVDEKGRRWHVSLLPDHPSGNQTVRATYMSYVVEKVRYYRPGEVYSTGEGVHASHETLERAQTHFTVLVQSMKADPSRDYAIELREGGRVLDGAGASIETARQSMRPALSAREAASQR